MGFDFFFTSLVVVLVPGTGVIYTVSTGLLVGTRASVVAAFGCTLGIVPHLLACVLGLAAILHTSPMAFQVVKYAGVVYLLYLAWGLWVDSSSLTLPEVATKPKESALSIVIRAILINVLNPKLSVFFLAFLPQFVPQGSPNALWVMVEFALIFMAMTFVVFALYGVGAGTLRRYIVNSPQSVQGVRRFSAVAFAAFAAKLALTVR